MVSLDSIERQLKQVGCNFKFWGRPEIIELQHILMPDETIAQCVNGQYEGGFALLCVTDQRVLLVDKKPLYLTIDDIRFDMISDVDFNWRLMSSSINILTGIKTLRFTAYSPNRLRLIMNYIQQRITEVRRRQSEAQQALANQVEQRQSWSYQPQPQPPVTSWQPADFDGFRRQIALQTANQLGPRAVAFSQYPPANLSRYKLPLARRRFQATT